MKEYKHTGDRDGTRLEPTLTCDTSEIYNKWDKSLKDSSKYVMPWKLLPDCRKFRIELKGEDLLFAMHDVDKRLKPTITIIPYTNKKVNRYLDHQVRRLNKAISNPTLFWTIARHLMLSSNAFVVMQINKTFPQWHRKVPLNTIRSTLKVYKAICRNSATDLEYYRVYIPKGEGKVRPLGVPTPGWRLYLSALNGFLTIFLREKISLRQHGFFPKRGCLTAWKQILGSGLLDSSNILEFDLKNFFDSVSLEALRKQLSKFSVPSWLIQRLEFISQNAPKFKEGAYTVVSEETPLEVGMLTRSMLKQELERQGKAVRDRGIIARYDKLNEFGIRVPSEKHAPWGHIFPETVGLPQGAPTSPLCASVVLESLLRQFGTLICQYADDGILAGDLWKYSITQEDGTKKSLLERLHDNDLFFNRVTKVEFNKDKTRWVKKDGQWLAPLKFLGLEYDGVKNLFSAYTRKGARLEFTKQDLITDFERYGPISKSLVLGGIKKNSKQQNKMIGHSLNFTWEQLAKSKIFGFIQSRLYMDKWNIEDLEQNFYYTSVVGSWARHVGNGETVDIYNSSSFASRWLLDRLSRNKSLNLNWKSPKRKWVDSKTFDEYGVISA